MFYGRRETFFLVYPSLWPSGIPDAGSVRLLWKSQCGKKRYCICVLLFCFVVTLGCSLPLVHFLSWIPPHKKKKKKHSSATSFSPLFHLPAQSILALLLMEITLSCLLQSQQTRDKNPSSVLGGFCEDIVCLFSLSQLGALRGSLCPPFPSPNPLPDCRLPNKVREFLEKTLEELLQPHSHFGPFPQLNYNLRQLAKLFTTWTTKEITLNAASNCNGSRACHNISLLMDYHARINDTLTFQVLTFSCTFNILVENVECCKNGLAFWLKNESLLQS